MSLIPYEPFRHLENMKRDFERLFNEAPITFGNSHHIGNIRADVHETDSEVIATCDIPGLESKEDVDIHVDNNTLHISGMVNKTNEVKEENMHRRERYEGRFQRSLSLPSPVSHEGITATYKNGVLEIKMPKVTKSSKKKIDVEFH